MSFANRNIYCISGLGADEKAFDRIKIVGCSLQHLDYIAPLKNESLNDYAKRMLEQIREENPVIIGLSFGGMIAIEMAKHISIGKLILISTAKTRNEIPVWMRLSGTLRLHKFIPIKSNRFTEKADDKRMGIQTVEEKIVVQQYRRNADRKYIDWGVDKILTWKNKWVPANTYHIHGEHDRMFPLKNIQPTHIIKEGTHIMILNMQMKSLSASMKYFRTIRKKLYFSRNRNYANGKHRTAYCRSAH